jgi:hypothetical protein
MQQARPAASSLPVGPDNVWRRVGPLMEVRKRPVGGEHGGCTQGPVPYGIDGRWLGHTAARAAVPLHHLLAVLTLRQELVMDLAHQTNVGRVMVAAPPVGLEMVELEPFGFGAPTTVFIQESVSMPQRHRFPDELRIWTPPACQGKNVGPRIKVVFHNWS